MIGLGGKQSRSTKSQQRVRRFEKEREKVETIKKKGKGKKEKGKRKTDVDAFCLGRASPGPSEGRRHEANSPCQPSYISVSGTKSSKGACLRSSSDLGRSAGMMRGRWSPSLRRSSGSMAGGRAEGQWRSKSSLPGSWALDS